MLGWGAGVGRSFYANDEHDDVGFNHDYRRKSKSRDVADWGWWHWHGSEVLTGTADR